LQARIKQANLRVGDLVTEDGQEYRVNGSLNGDGTQPFEVSLHIDFTTGAIPANSVSGSAWVGALTLPKDGTGSMNLNPAPGSKQKVWGVPVSELQITAALENDKNLLKAMKQPASVHAGDLVRHPLRVATVNRSAHLHESLRTSPGKTDTPAAQ